MKNLPGMRQTVELPVVRTPERNDYVEDHERYVARRDDLTATRDDLPAIEMIEMTMREEG